MVFLCFSSKDRENISESVYYHLNNIGIEVWYDRKEILMGDNRDYKNFVEGVDSCNYGIIILSPNSIASYCANEEIDLMYKKYKSGEMHIFPVFYNLLSTQIPEKYQWMKKLVYKELDITKDSRGLCNHIACKVLKDEIEKNCQYKTISEISHNSSGFIKELTLSYLETDGNNYNSRITLLYSGILYLNNLESIKMPLICEKGSTYLFNETKLNLLMDLRETLIFERLFILAVNLFLLINNRQY